MLPYLHQTAQGMCRLLARLRVVAMLRGRSVFYHSAAITRVRFAYLTRLSSTACVQMEVEEQRVMRPSQPTQRGIYDRSGALRFARRPCAVM